MIEGNPVRFRYPATRLSASIACAGDVQGCAADQVTLTFYGISGGWRWSRDRSVAFLSDGERWEVADAQVRRTTDVLTGSLVSERLEVALTREQFARLADSVSGVVLGRVELPLHPDHRAGLQALADALANWSRL